VWWAAAHPTLITSINMTIDAQTIEQLRVQFADIPPAMMALTTLSDCEGDLEDTAMTLAIRIGQQPDINNSDWLASLAKKCRVAVCRSEFRNDLVDGSFVRVFKYFEENKVCPSLLILPVLLYVNDRGVNLFCQPLDPL
jgi:hypothetical protein